MKSLDILLQQYELGEPIEYIFFWGHTPGKTQQMGAFCFSQWYVSPFTRNEKTYFTAEHFMMAEKARLFGDVETESKILQTEKPALVKELGRQIRNFDEKTWIDHRFDIVAKGNYLKFTQNPSLKDFLLSTKDKVLVEASPVDNIWGIGLAKDNPDIENPNKWKGLNLLGFALMEVRDKIRIMERSFQFNHRNNTIILYRPVGPKELELIKKSNWKKFPPRLPEQPIFYPVLNEDYASQIAKEWNVPSSGLGYVTRFEIQKDFAMQYEVQNAGGDHHNELWIPAEELETFNQHMVGEINVIKEFK